MDMQQWGRDFMDVMGCIVPLVGFLYIFWRFMHNQSKSYEQRKKGAQLAAPAAHPHSKGGATKNVAPRIAHLKAKQWLKLINDMPDVYPHLFLVGKTRSGKTLTCQVIVAHRGGQFCIIDPKDRPGKWGDSIQAVALDDDLSYSSIERYCQAGLDLLKHRQKAMNNGIAEFESMTIIIDEFPMVVSECPTAAILYKKVGQIGAELRVRLIALSTSDRVKTLGIAGEGDSRDNFLLLAFGKKAREMAGNMSLPAYPCVAELDESLAIFDTREVPKLAALGIEKERIWIAPGSDASSALEKEKTAQGNATTNAPEAGQKEGEPTAETTAETTADGIQDWQRQAIIAMARDKISRSKICERIFGSRGGRDYEKIKQVLDEVGL